jgi:FixJ family two-component response regulator
VKFFVDSLSYTPVGVRIGMMKPISRKKEIDIVAILIKGKSTREIAKSLGFSQSIVNRMRRKHCSSLELPQ